MADEARTNHCSHNLYNKQPSFQPIGHHQLVLLWLSDERKEFLNYFYRMIQHELETE